LKDVGSAIASVAGKVADQVDKLNDKDKETLGKHVS
jgi:hypothetical protein